jgi:CRP-like cAMP-binding protein
MQVLSTKILELMSDPSFKPEQLLSFWQPVKLEKGEYFLREGTVCNYLYYVSQGSVRSFFYQEEREITEWIALEGMFFSPPRSYYEAIPSRLNFQAIESSLIYKIHRKDLDELCAKQPEIELFHRKLLEHFVIACETRIHLLLAGSAQQRYQHLIAAYPNILSRVPLAYIATFIGITQETLSRIRGNKQ